MKSLILVSFLFFVSVYATNIEEPISNVEESNDELEDFYDDDDNYDFNSDDNEDIIYSSMVSAKPPATPPVKLTSSLLSPPVTPPPCKKWRCSMNGYTPIWKPDVSAACKNNYSKMGIMTKAVCQDQFCVKVCEKF
jgi:hypothetical protein